MRPLAIVSADWHLRSDLRIWASKEQPAGDVLVSIQAIVDYCKKFTPKYAILAGDILNSSRTTSETVAILSQFSDEVAPYVEKILFIQGQHDYGSVPWLQAIGKNNFQYLAGDDKLLDTEYGVMIVGIDNKRSADAFYAELSQKNLTTSFPVILVAHQLWKEIFSWGECSLKELPPEITHVISGDFHYSILRQFSYSSRVLTFVSPGPIAPNNISESFGLDVYLLNEELLWNALPLPRRTFKQLTISSQEELDFIVDEVRSEYEKSDLPEQIRKSVLDVSIRASLFPILEEKVKDFAYVYLREFIPEVTLEATKVRSSQEFSYDDIVLSQWNEEQPELLSAVQEALRLLRQEGKFTFEPLYETLSRTFERSRANATS